MVNTLNTFDAEEGRCNELVVQAYGICSKDRSVCQGGTRQLPFSQGVLKFANQTYHALYLFILFMHHEMQKEDTGGFDDV